MHSVIQILNILGAMLPHITGIPIQFNHTNLPVISGNLYRVKYSNLNLNLSTAVRAAATSYSGSMSSKSTCFEDSFFDRLPPYPSTTFLSGNFFAVTCAHFFNVIMSTKASHKTAYWVFARSGADQRRHRRSVSLAFVRRIQRWRLDSPYKVLVTQKMFPFDDVTIR